MGFVIKKCRAYGKSLIDKSLDNSKKLSSKLLEGSDFLSEAPNFQGELIIPGLFELECEVFTDSRGSSFEAYSERIFSELGINSPFVQDNMSSSKKNVLRGLHFQTKHPQSKLIHCVRGKIFDVALDLRKTSPTFGLHSALIMDGEKQNMLFIPKGFAHGFLSLCENSILSYKCSDFYDPEGEGGILWNDKSLFIEIGRAHV